MIVGLFGAFDRNNFGDVLMPIIYSKILNKRFGGDATIKYYALASRDLSKICGPSTLEIRKAYEHCDVMVAVGGDLLCNPYQTMYFHLQKNPLYIFFLRCLRKVGLCEKFSKMVLHGKEKLPWILDKKKLKCVKLIYNTVGGTPPMNVDKELALIDYLSVRNLKDYHYIKSRNENAVLCPDSMLIASEILQDFELEAHTRRELKEIIKRDYVVFQIANHFPLDSNSINYICDQLKQTVKKYNCKCLLLPIGRCQGHEDQIILGRIANKCNMDDILCLDETNVYETINVLKKAKAFIGTSLHGCVLSLSYNTPYAIIKFDDEKMTNYFSTWESEADRFIDITAISNFYSRVIENYDYYLKINQEIYKEQIKLVKKNFDDQLLILSDVLKTMR